MAEDVTVRVRWAWDDEHRDKWFNDESDNALPWNFPDGTIAVPADLWAEYRAARDRFDQLTDKLIAIARQESDRG